MEKETGGYAFPVPDYDSNGNRKTAEKKGMTLRDYFAGQALAAIVAKPNSGSAPMTNPHKRAAQIAYLYADAMIEARGE
ncbi:hypothetical protein ACXIVK_24090 [Paraburkholderia caledonica]